MSEHSLSAQEPLPTDFTKALGERIRAAREERRLADRIRRRQATISDFERGLRQPDATTLVILAEELQKPITYFFPLPWGQRVTRGDLTYDEQALLLEFRRLKSDEYRRIAINQLAALAETELQNLSIISP